MNRLIQGDVGSGKTIVAFLALLLAVSNGFQGALMAPTELLAAQHFEQLMRLTESYQLPFRPALLTGSVSACAKKEIYRGIREGEVNVVIGTHALIQEKVTYLKLGLVITDEQHRFGVRQREQLNENIIIEGRIIDVSSFYFGKITGRPHCRPPYTSLNLQFLY